MDNSVMLIVVEVLLGLTLILIFLFNKNILFNSRQDTDKKKKQKTTEEK